MTTSAAPLSSRPADSAVLLVLLPVAAGAAGAAQLATNTALTTLQQQLGSAIRVLRVDEASHPVVVRSFQPTNLPALVLVQQGVELWRQQGLPEGNTLGPLLLSKLRPAR
ncbi:thioredoxin [Hymenobacter aquaticus]|uniref:Thioredoxin n=1 Tax=Hymenobacter aquaticus TaxID=1867101 RepID=A0A4Z0Q555_9BACT|nr:thioredoxin [Hymenobacter aquaticus]TGE24815.1 thioredoxin [Hymenobacter aquaticus]